MKGEFSRLSFDRRKHYAGVLQQQGRVGLDSDWNEWVEIQLHRLRLLTKDAIGGCGRPEGDPGFEISVDATVSPPDLLISDGRLYAGGLVAESESPGKQGTRFSAQPDWPIGTQAAWTTLVPDGPAWPGLDLSTIATGATLTQLIYAEVWLQHVTALNDEAARDQAYLDAAGNPDWTARPEAGDYIRERALGGPDTGTRLQTVAQVKHWDNLPAGTETCDQACASLKQALPPGTIGTMLLNVVPTPPVTDPCQEPLQGGYGGAWNRTYRVEIHDGGAAGTATFKWSTENGAFAVRINGTALTSAAAGSDITVTSIGNDQETQLSANDWVEVCGEETELGVFRNALAQVNATPVANTDGTWTIQLTAPVVIPHAPFLRRWSAGLQLIELNQQFNLDAGSGLAVTFFDASGGTADTTNFHIQDYWTWSARVDIRTVEPETLTHVAEPPRGIERHYCCLAILTWQNQNGSIVNTSNVQCTPVFPPLTGITSGGCDCSVCVSADSHNNNILTIQSAISQVEGNGGGKVCLGTGIYNVTSTITVSGDAAIDICGHGLPSLVAGATFTPQQPMLLIDGAMNISVEGIAFVGPPDDPNQSPIPGVVISNSSFVTIERCVFTSGQPGTAAPARTAAVAPAATSGQGPGGTLSPAIGVSGFAQNTQIHDNYFTNVQIAIGPSPIGQASTPFLVVSSIRNNRMECTVAGLAFSDQANVAFLQAVSFFDNFVSSPSGFVLLGSGSEVFIERNSFIVAGANAIASNASQSRISENSISPDPNHGGDGIFLDSSSPIQDVLITGNQISGLLGSGIVVSTAVVLYDVVISQNRLENLGGPGILAFSGTFLTDVDITGNLMTSVGQTQSIALFTPPAIQGGLGGILLLGSGNTNVKICENIIEGVGPAADVTPPAEEWILGIYVSVASGLRIAGNRIINVAPMGPVTRGSGILLAAVTGRADVIDNEVRRTTTPPGVQDSSPWTALEIDSVDDVSIRGNLLESFGSTPTVVIVATASCLFCDNQCFLDNSVLDVAAVILVVNIFADAIIASNNYLQGLGLREMSLNPTSQPPQLTVLGNVLNGQITVGPGIPNVPLPAPWAALNVTFFGL